MYYYPSPSSPMLSCLVLSLLAIATRALPIKDAASLNDVVPIHASTPLHLLDEGHHSLMKRAIGGIHMSSGPVGVNGHLDVVRRAVGTVADPGSASAIHMASTLKRRSAPRTAGEIPSIILPSDGPRTPAVDDNGVENLLSHLVKRSPRLPHTTRQSVKPAPATRVSGKPVTEEKWRQRAWK